MGGPHRPGLNVIAAVLFFVGPPRHTREPGGTKGDGMQRARRCSEEAVFAVWERIVEVYTPYVLVRCARYTNGRRQAQQIGAYTLIVTCLAARAVGHAVPVGRIVESILGVVGPDVIARAGGEDWRDGPDEPLLADPRLRYMATALNALKRRGREVLVLHHVAGLTPGSLARLLEQPPDAVLVRIGRAQRHLAGWLSVRDVRGALAEFAAGLDTGWMQEAASCALGYLARQARPCRSRPARPDWN
jgi:DNA-directed RNA polymerase specialized sigma24 family protein